ncbi:MAG: bifunctional hydroxymethylpyrimidine kinase/phosphomethylpyrimidine kinase [Nitrospirota bacterium]
MKKVLSIAGSDPSGGAGIQMDIKTFQALGAFGMTIPAALTAQNSKGVTDTCPVSPEFFNRQLETLLTDIKPDAVKTGMLLHQSIVESIAKAVRSYRIKNLIIDPVITSSSGKMLLQPSAVKVLKQRLFPLALVITPNIPEAEALTGMSIKTEQDMDFAAGKLLDMGPSYVLIKGGHKKGSPTDTLYGGKTVLSFSTTRKKGEFHGTGCVLSAAISVFITRGFPVEKAVEKAKQFVDNLLKKAKPVGKGRTKYFQF